MELIGTVINKNFEGFGIFTGSIQSFDSSSGYFRIQYEDGDSEDVDFDEIRSILREMGGSSPKLEPFSQRRPRGRPPKKRSRLDENSGNFLDFQSGCAKMEVDEALDEDLRGGMVMSRPDLPPSSKDLDLDGINAFDLFSVYTCLRTFSRQLFLSPFRLEMFVEALRCEHANYLIDSIHFSILQALKPHLDSLSEEGSEAALDCLRYLNWDILDLVTWPVFLVRYLVINEPEMKPGFRLGQLKLLDSEYYKQPPGVKLEILRCLCDDVIEVDSIRSEINRRMGSDNMDTGYIEMNVKKKRKFSAMTIDPSAEEETNDGNFDECCLCGMDGSLICCDGCPAAFHSRCVGVAKDLLPEGEWYCPECSVERSDGLKELLKPSRGAELLGIDPHGRLYYVSCNHLLV